MPHEATSDRPRLRVRWVVALLLAVAVLVGTFFISGLLIGLLIIGGSAVALVVAGRPDEYPADPPSVTRRLIVALPLSALVLLVVALGVAHIAVWNPLAKVPGLSLEEIYLAMDAAGERPAWVFLSGWAAFWTLTALALPIVALVMRSRPWVSDRRIAVMGLLAAGGAALTSWFAGFNHGMSIADAFMTSGGDAAASGSIIVAIGALATLAAVFLAWPRARAGAPAAA